MMAESHYDALIIGAGAAGSSAATTAAEHGARVALIERDKIGGTCLNYGCDPTKTLLHIARTLYHAQHSQSYGLRIPQTSYDWQSVQAFVHDVILRIRGGTQDEASTKLGKQGIEVIKGEATFTSAHDITVNDRTITAERIIIASGSQTLVPPIEGLRETGFITNVEAVSLPSLPRRMAIIGGGAIGIEFAQMFHRFGVDITVIERSSLILDKEDRELASLLCDLLEKEGIRLQTSAELTRVARTPGGKLLTWHCQDKTEEQLEVDEILLAIGRRPTLESLKLEAAGIKAEKKGISVDKTLRTNVPHIWAAGDVATPYQFTHVAYEQGKLAAQNAFAREPQPFDDRAIPWVTYTDPALAHVGKTEEQLQDEKVHYRVGHMKLSEVERAIAEDRTDGLVKLLVDQQGMILGGHILAARADDMLSPVILAMRERLPIETLATTIIPYPTMSEAVRWAATKVQ